ncbi:MAG TPA: phytase [Chitinophagaceae bacterium]|nr:phytase [Chitinophagaceae bacterium]
MHRQTILFFSIVLLGCSSESPARRKNSTALPAPLKPLIISEPVQYDTDDPAIWINPSDPAKSLVVGTDKDSDGGLYVFNLEGKIVNKVGGLKRPNNVDIAYGLKLNGHSTDVAVLTERESGRIRIYSMPDLKPLDNGGIEVFAGEQEHWPMGIALYTAPDSTLYAIVGRKSGPSDTYLWQYKLSDKGDGTVAAAVVRKFGQYSGKKEIESIAVDNELGYVYYSDEMFGIHKYYAHPDSGKRELALFGQKDFKEDVEGISIYKQSNGTGYILVSNQQANTFNVYPREGSPANPHEHLLIRSIPFSTIESDGSEVTNIRLGDQFPEGLFVAMTNGKTFHFYDWKVIRERLNQP